MKTFKFLAGAAALLAVGLPPARTTNSSTNQSTTALKRLSMTKRSMYALKFLLHAKVRKEELLKMGLPMKAMSTA